MYVFGYYTHPRPVPRGVGVAVVINNDVGKPPPRTREEWDGRVTDRIIEVVVVVVTPTVEFPTPQLHPVGVDFMNN